MAAKQGRLEARYTFSANQQVSWTDSAGGPLTATVTAGNYYPHELASALQTSIQGLTGAVGANASVTISDGEGGTGRCTITTSDTPWSLSWTTTPMRDALGFSANISNVSAAQTGTHVRGLWLPGLAKFSQYGDGAGGTIETDLRHLVGPTGVVTTLMGNKRRVHKNARWTSVVNSRALAHFESVTNESFESFFLDVATGRVSSYIPVGAYVRLVWDADVDGTYAVGRLMWPDTFDLEQYVSGWVGRFRVDLPPLMVES
jgi:hypothetical protein